MVSYFFSIFVATIIITRLFLFLYPVPSPTLGKLRIHHYMYGIVIILIGILFHSIIIYAIGLGLFVDELTYLLIKGKTHEDNYSAISLLGTLAFILLVFLIQIHILNIMNLMNTSDLILLITAIFIGWQALETRRSVQLTKIKDQPFLEIEFINNDANVILKNLGQSPAYSPSVSNIQISENEYYEFDPLHRARTPILPNEERNIWMHNVLIHEKSIGSFTESVAALKLALMNRESKDPMKIHIQYSTKTDTNSRELFTLDKARTHYQDNMRINIFICLL